MEAGLGEGDGDVKDKEGRVALVATLADACTEATGQAGCLERTQEAAPALVAHKVAQIILRLLPVGCQQRGQLEGDRQLVALPDCWHQVQPAALREQIRGRQLPRHIPLEERTTVQAVRLDIEAHREGQANM